MTPDIQKSILGACARFIRKQLEPVTKQLDDLRGASVGFVEKGELAEVQRLWEERYSNPGAWIPKALLPMGEKGEPGKDADPISMPDVAAEILATDELKTLVDLHVAEAVAKYFEENPIQHGKDGKPGEKGEPGESIKGEPGADGVGLAGAVINRAGELVVTKTNGEAIALGVVVGKDGDSGKDGADGLGFDDLSATYDGERGVVLKFQRGEVVKEFALHLPVVIDRGYWREGTEAKAGDAMTHDGTLWIALRDTKAKPARESEDWRIGARKGRDGLQGPPGKAYTPPGPVVLDKP
jgi:hypothetical protein